MYVQRRLPTLFQSQSIPFITSTDLIPLNGLSAHPSIKTTMREQILQALLRLDPAAVPAMYAAGLAKFTIPSSYNYPRILAAEAGVLSPTETRTHCLGQFPSPADLVTCPAGYTEVPDVLAGCAAAGLACPNALVCLCRPCVLQPPANVYPWPVVLGLCIALFLVGLWFSLCWRIPLETAHLIQAVPKYDLLAGGATRGGKGAV